MILNLNAPESIRIAITTILISLGISISIAFIELALKITDPISFGVYIVFYAISLIFPYKIYYRRSRGWVYAFAIITIVGSLLVFLTPSQIAFTTPLSKVDFLQSLILGIMTLYFLFQKDSLRWYQ